MSRCPDPGIYPDVADVDYFAWDAVNNSSMGPALRSMKHYKAALDRPRTATPAMEFGRFVHQVVLEPELLAANYVVMPDFAEELRDQYKNPRATKVYKERVAEFRETNAGRECVDVEWYDHALAMIGAVKACPRAALWLRGEGETETSIVWNDPLTGLRCKARIDKRTGDNVEEQCLIDLKTTADASKFDRSMVAFGYARQAAFYRDGMELIDGVPYDFAFVAVEKEPPYATLSGICSDELMAYGRREYQGILRRICEGRAYDKWPGYDQPAELDLPSWAYQAEDVVLGVAGEEIRI